MNSRPKRRVALVGAGNIAEAHAQALSTLENIEIAAVIDPRLSSAKALAERHNVKLFATHRDEILSQTAVDCAHILVPPHLHYMAALPWIEDGVAVFLEKPFAVSVEESEALLDRAKKSDAIVGVNQNYIYQPCFQKVLQTLGSGIVGRVRHVSAVFSMPLRQLDVGQLGHWMFQQPLNILLEQAVHPLSQLRYLLGPVSLTHALTREEQELAPDTYFFRNWQFELKGASASGSLSFAVGESLPTFQMIIVATDGLIFADMMANVTHVIERSRWPDPYDMLRARVKASRQMRLGVFGNFADYVLSQIGLRPRSDAFYQGMLGSIRDFHASLDRGVGPIVNGEFGRDLIRICEEACRAAKVVPNKTAPKSTTKHETCDVVVLGGTGFIGRELITQLVDKGLKIRVMARNLNALPEIFAHGLVQLVKGDVTSDDDVDTALNGCSYVVNLAHGGGGSDRMAIYSALAGSAERVGKACLKHKVEMLVHISSIAALYLGDAQDVITPKTPCDPKSDERGDYAWAKAQAEGLLMKLHHEHGLNVTIQRPGLVVGKGTSPFHSGLGFFNNEQHCVGWNKGCNALPFVLAEDTARAIVLALNNEHCVGRADNIVGDVQLSAQQFYEHIRTISGRPFQFHPQSTLVLQGSEICKWAIKRIGGRKVPFPGYRDLLSRGLMARFDCEETKSILGWSPNADEKKFIDVAITSTFGGK